MKGKTEAEYLDDYIKDFMNELLGICEEWTGEIEEAVSGIDGNYLSKLKQHLPDFDAFVKFMEHTIKAAGGLEK